MDKTPVIPVILCGGSGSRLWPLSRKSFPKQYLSLNHNKNTLLQITNKRLVGIQNLKNPILVCNEEHRFIVAEQMREIGIQPDSILLEPFGRNTAPAALIATLHALNSHENPLILILSSDHIIKNEEIFRQTICSGIAYAEKGRIVTFGSIPTSPETGYGYIETNEPFFEKIEGKEIIRFIEKPNIKSAQHFLKGGKHTWNSGIFLFKAKTFANEIRELSPDLYKNCQKCMSNEIQDLDFKRIDKDSFEKCLNVSIDIAVMEKTKLGTVLPMRSGWSDIGSWKSVWENAEKDVDGNSVIGKVIAKDCKNSYLRSEKRLVVGIGIENLILIETGDAILAAEKSQSQKVKDIVKELQERGINEGQEHKKVYRPWGYYLSLIEGTNWQVKFINVKPGESLSLQKHNHRSEHWVILKGKAKIELDEKVFELIMNQSCYIPLGSKHRLSNLEKEELTVLEVQSGSYLGEDDIKRYDDNYGRQIT